MSWAPVSGCVHSLILFSSSTAMMSLHLQTLRPRERQTLIRRLEVIRHVALAADIGAHLLPRGHRVDIVVLHSLRSLQRANALDEGRTGDA